MSSRLKRIVEKRMSDLGMNSIRDTERRAGVPADTLRNLLAGRTQTVHASKIESLARTLKLSVSELVGGQDVYAQRKAMKNAAIIRVFSGLEFGADGEPDAPISAVVGVEGELLGVTVNEATDIMAEMPDDSMVPTFQRGDILLIRLGEVLPIARKIYLIGPIGAPLIRRLTKRLSDGTYDVTADNDQFLSESGITAEKIEVIGAILAVFKRL